MNGRPPLLPSAYKKGRGSVAEPVKEVVEIIRILWVSAQDLNPQERRRCARGRREVGGAAATKPASEPVVQQDQR